jgi:DNA-binding PadR family transcriptional regulator
MPPVPPDPEDQLPLTPAVFHILLALADVERHGYAIMEQVKQATDGQVRMGPGTLYGTIKRLLAGGLVAESGERPDPKMDDERRRYYRLTDWGRQVMAAEARRYAKVVNLIRAAGVLASAGFPMAGPVPRFDL